MYKLDGIAVFSVMLMLVACTESSAPSFDASVVAAAATVKAMEIADAVCQLLP